MDASILNGKALSCFQPVYSISCATAVNGGPTTKQTLKFQTKYCSIHCGHRDNVLQPKRSEPSSRPDTIGSVDVRFHLCDCWRLLRTHRRPQTLQKTRTCNSSSKCGINVRCTRFNVVLIIKYKFITLLTWQTEKYRRQSIYLICESQLT